MTRSTLVLTKRPQVQTSRGPKAYKLLPPEAIDELTGLLADCRRRPGLQADCRRRRAWPWQVIFNVMVLLAKARGGYRTVGLLQFFTRLGTRTFRPATRKWCRAHADHWDHAISMPSG